MLKTVKLVNLFVYLQESEKTLCDMIKRSNVFELLCKMLGDANTLFIDQIAKAKEDTAKENEQVKKKLTALYEEEKECVASDNLMVISACLLSFSLLKKIILRYHKKCFF